MEPEKQVIEIPEREATDLAKRLRHSPKLPGVALSVYGYVSRSGVRALHVAVDYGESSYDIRYRADTDISKLEANAIRRICAQFDL